MKKVIAFDLDGTLADSKSPVTYRICELLDGLLEHFHVCVMSGGKFEQFQKQLLSNLQIDPERLEKLHIMPTCGTRYYAYDKNKGDWENIYAEDLTDEQKTRIRQVLDEGAKELGLVEEKVYGEIIEDRGSQMSWSALGQDIVTVLGPEGVKIKEDWDADNAKKQKLRDYAAPRLPDLEVRVGGLTTVDVTKKGIDKAYGIQKLMEIIGIGKQDILFIGDRLVEGGNDYPVKAFGVDSIQISHWQETAVAIEAIIHMAA